METCARRRQPVRHPHEWLHSSRRLYSMGKRTVRRHDKSLVLVSADDGWTRSGERCHSCTWTSQSDCLYPWFDTSLHLYASLEEAQSTREGLDGCRWASTNPKTLIVRFGRQEQDGVCSIISSSSFLLSSSISVRVTIYLRIKCHQVKLFLELHPIAHRRSGVSRIFRALGRFPADLSWLLGNRG